MSHKITLFLVLAFANLFAFANPSRTTYQAKIVKPDGYPLEATNVNFKFSILDPGGSCILYAETYSAVNMAGSSGLISFALGSGIKTYPTSSTTFSDVFSNQAASLSCDAGGPVSYAPVPIDNRKIVMQFNDGGGWQTLPSMSINAVPYAMYASKSNDSKTLNGKSDTAFVENATLASLGCNSATHAIAFNGVSFSCLAVGSGGSGGVTSVTTSGTVLITGGTASAPVISIKAVTTSQDGYLTSVDYAEFKAKLAASSTHIVNTLGYAPVSSSAVTSQIEAAAAVSATANTIVKRDASGNALLNGLSANTASLNYVDIYKPSSSFNIRLQAPTSLTANYTLILPATSGTIGQVLSTDGWGNLSWINPSTGSVTSVSATAPLASTGGSTPTISITQATSSTDGYLSATDFNTFRNKQTATSSAIIATLGYTPADNAASGTYAQKANNLSDLTNILSARTNLGLGTLAVGNSIDLGSASATGTLAIARLPSFSGDATIAVASNTIVLSNSGVSAGTYVKVTVDEKGRVTSSSSLASLDVTTALGYTPAHASSATQWTTNGLNIYYTTGNIGVGVINPNAKLELASGTASLAPLKFSSGTLLSSSQSGSMEYDGFNFYLTDGSSNRKAIATGSNVNTIDNVSNINSSGNITMTPAGSVIVSATTASTNSQTGALIVKGGLGVAGNMNTAGNLNVSGSQVIDGTLKLSSMSSGSVLFAGANGLVTQDNSSFYWDGANKRLGIGTAVPAEKLEVSRTDFSANNASNIIAHLVSNKHSMLKMTPGVSGSPWSIFAGGDTDRFGIYSYNAATERLSVLSNGNVGIGTTVPDQKLTVANGTVAGNNVIARFGTIETNWQGLYVQSLTNVGTLIQSTLNGISNNNLILNSNGGNVGVGTSSPTEKLHVVGNGIVGDLKFHTGSGGGGEISAVSGNGDIRPHTGASGAFRVYSGSVGSGAERFTITNAGNVGIGTSSPQAQLQIGQSALTGTPSSTTESRRLAIATNTHTGATFDVYERDEPSTANLDFRYSASNVSGSLLTLVHNGNVGIGIAAPNTSLSFGDTHSNVVGCADEPHGYTHGAGCRNDVISVYEGTPQDKYGFGIHNATLEVYGAGHVEIGRRNSDGTGAFNPAVHVNLNGNVGIGTTAPATKLEVTGGNITAPSQTFFEAKLCSTVVNASGVMIWETEIRDTSNAYNAATGLFTAPIAGTYQFGFNTLMNNAGSGEYRYSFYKNNVQYDTIIAQKAASTWQTIQGTITTYLNAGDTIHIQYQVGVGATYTDCDYNRFWGRLEN